MSAEHSGHASPPDPSSSQPGVPPSDFDPLKSVPSPAPDAKEEAFYAAALRRILRNLWLLTVVLLVPAVLRFGWPPAAGFAAGGIASWLSFRSLAEGAQGLADRIVNAHSKERGGVVVARFLLRYLLVGVVAYVIFKRSAGAFRGFLWGLTVPAGAMLIEAAYEGYVAFRRVR